LLCSAGISLPNALKSKMMIQYWILVIWIFFPSGFTSLERKKIIHHEITKGRKHEKGLK